ncbi:hypothetical protein THRCLA_21874 [Thraustotheca clavata]|uniref:Uncharacterized protein n=1 Tax=Thraustotheca clavata TaxID=74557 RepID=A0A1V9ZLB1_9STRA|nr:hypothetical protein THRCLA_21874 [Thraustotheca clavata]
MQAKRRWLRSFAFAASPAPRYIPIRFTPAFWRPYIGDVRKNTSPLTQFLYKNESGSYCSESDVSVWCDVFQFGWDGDLEQLPRIKPRLHLFEHIHTREMHAKSKEYFANLLSTEPYQIDCNPDDDVDIPLMPYIEAAAMKNLWRDVLDEWLQDPRGLAYIAITGGHSKLLQCLATEYHVDLKTFNLVDC